MEMIFSSPTNLVLGAILEVIAVVAGSRGARLLARGVRDAGEATGPVAMIRGFRGLTVALALVASGAGVVLAEKGLLAFGAAFLAEELYETGVLLLILRSGHEAGAA